MEPRRERSRAPRTSPLGTLWDALREPSIEPLSEASKPRGIIRAWGHARTPLVEHQRVTRWVSTGRRS